ncbi:MAG: cell division protein ZapA [Magnetococcales bacterium]|nr:cell division protein ZapA [Magnetococcales bacterium]
MSDFVEVRIKGQPFRIKKGNNPQYVQELAGYVNGVMEEIGKQIQSPDHQKVAIMAAMRIADDLFQLRQEKASADGRMETAERKLQHLIEVSAKLLAE